MPNILAHTYITAEVFGPEPPDVILGSTLPDFAGMFEARYGHKVTLDGLSRLLSAGVAFHKRTDSVFDDQPEKPQATSLMAEDLQTVGLPYQAARMSAAMAADILLDRALLDNQDAFAGFLELAATLTRGDTGLEDDEINKAFSKYIKDYFNEEVPKRYADPRNIASIIEHRLSTRTNPTIKIRYEHRRPLADVIDGHAARVGALGMVAAARTIEELRTPVAVD
jgi:hypothetical protein